GLTVSGQITGNSSLIKIGPGILYLSNTNNTYNGNTSITGGTLSAAGPGSLGASGSVTISNATLDFSGPATFARNILLSGSGANTIQADNGVLTLSGTISGSGGLTKSGIGTLAIVGSSNSYGGGTTVLVGTLQLQGAKTLSSTSALTVAGGASLDLNGFSPSLANISGSGAVTNSKPFTTSTLSAAYVGGAASYAAAIQDGQGQVAVNVPSSGLLTLSNTANTYSGGTTVSGTLSVAADGNLGAGGGVVLLNSGVLQAASGITLGSGRTISLLGNSGFDVPAGQTLAFGGVVSGAGALTKTSNGTLLLSGANNFTGGVTISGGNLAVASAASLGDSGGTVTINGGALEFTTSMTSSQTLNLANTESYVQVDAGTVTHAGYITGPGSLVKTGPGALAVTNPNNDYSGGTGVVDGVLLDNDPTGQALGTGTTAITIFAGAQLAGTGTISQPVTCNGGGVSPGQGSTIGTLSLQQGLRLSNASSVTFKLANQSGNAVSDCIDFEPNPSSGVTAAGLAVSGTCTAYLTGTPVPVTGTPYTLFDHVRTSSGNAPGSPSLNLVPPPGYMANWTVSQPLLDNTNYTYYYQIGATLTGPLEWMSTGGTAAWTTDADWSTGYSPSYPNNGKASEDSYPALLGMNGSGTITLTPGAATYASVLIFDNSSSYTIAAPSSGTMAGGKLVLGGIDNYLLGGKTVNSVVEVVTGSHSITAPVELQLPTDITMFDPAAALTIQGAVSGTGSLTLSGSGRLILSGANTYSGGTTISGGVLSLANSAALRGAITFSGGSLQFTASNRRDYSAAIVNSSGPISIDTNGQTVTFANGLASSNSGGLTKFGSGALILSGTNSYSGGTTVDGGTLYLTNSESILPNSALTVVGSTLIFDPTAATMSPMAPGAAGAVASAVSPVPEPGTLAILAAGAICCLAARSWRRRRSGL
ncbi:MAG: autotransporter-associated beta strand repeat-containing protein, partial [Thermoguttaceae bacterium]